MSDRRPTVWWKYYKIKTIRGKNTVKCKFCLTIYTKVNRIICVRHIISCEKCPPEISKQLKAEPFWSKPKRNNQKAKLSCDPVSNFDHHSDLKESFSKDVTLPSLLNNSQQKINDEEKCIIDAKMARAIYDSGISFCSMQSNLWKEALIELKPGYEAPLPYLLQTSLLEAESDRIKQKINKFVSQSTSLGLIICEGTDNLSVIDFIVTTPEPLLFKTVNLENKFEIDSYLSAEVDSIFNEVTGNKLIAIVTENTSNLKELCNMFKQRNPLISAITCFTNVMNLLIDDIIGTVVKYKDVIDIVLEIMEYIKDNLIKCEYLKKIQMCKNGLYKSSRELINRKLWDTIVMILESFLYNKDALKAIFSNTEFHFERYFVCVITSEDIWIEILDIINILKPIVSAITKLESDTASLSDVPVVLKDIKGKLENEMRKNKILNGISLIVERRCDSALLPIHIAANILDPKYKGKMLSIENIFSGIKFLCEYSSFNNLKVEDVMVNIAQYYNKSGFYNQVAIWDELMLQKIDSKLWWKGYCDSQVISRIALDLLNIPPTTAVFKRKLAPLSKNQNILLTCEQKLKLKIIRYNLHLRDDTVKVLSTND